MQTSYPNAAWDGDSDSRNSNDGKQSAPDHQDWTRMIAEIAATQQKAINDVLGGVGESSVVEGLIVHETGNHAVHKTEFVLEDIEITITDAGAAGAHGYIEIYTFPIAHILVKSGHIKLTNTVAGIGGIANNAALDIGVGHEAVSVANETLSLYEQGATTKIDMTLTGGTSTNDNAINTTDTHHDGSGVALELFLNVAIEDASCNADDTLTISGKITIIWVDCGCS